MKIHLLAFLGLCGTAAWGDAPDIAIPDSYAAAIKAADYVEVSGTSDSGAPEEFTIHNAKAISQFVQLLTSDRYTAVPKSLKPDFHSKSSYHVRLSANGAPVLELQIIGDSVLDIPGESSFYMESDRYSENLMAPLLRLR